MYIYVCMGLSFDLGPFCYCIIIMSFCFVLCMHACMYACMYVYVHFLCMCFSFFACMSRSRVPASTTALGLLSSPVGRKSAPASPSRTSRCLIITMPVWAKPRGELGEACVCTRTHTCTHAHLNGPRAPNKPRDHGHTHHKHSYTRT